jgi:small subunit ribosomal protein S17
MAEEEEQNVEATEPEVEETVEAEAAPAEAEAEAPAEAEAEASEDAGEAAEAAAEPEPDPLDDLPRKERLRLLKSRKPNPPKPPRSGAERQAEREEERKRKARQRAKRRAEARAEAKKNAGAAGTPPAERESNQPKVRQGVVVSNKADKTITVRIDTARRHRRYEKIVRRSRTLHAHDERNEAAEGDTVRVVETRPLSKTKRWRLVEIVEKAR